MDQLPPITKVDDASYQTTTTSVTVYNVADDTAELADLQAQAATIAASIAVIQARLTAASTAGVTDATTALQTDQSTNEPQG